MATDAVQTVDPPSTDTAVDSPRRQLLTRVAFRFTFSYCCLFFLTEPRVTLAPLGVIGKHLPPEAWTWQQHTVQPVVDWTATHVFGTEATLREPIQSGDQKFFWVLTFCLLVAAVLATVLWSAVDRRRPEYVTVHAWLRLVVRFCLAGQLFAFGFAKVLPLQMSLPLTRLVEPFGDFSPMNVLWTQVGLSQPYEILLGCAEVCAGFLLIFPRTTTLGALLALVEMTQVFILNLAYDVPLKILTFHLLLLAAVLLAPDASRLARFFVSDREVGPSTQPPLARGRRASRIALCAQIVFGLWLAGSQVHQDWKLWNQIGDPGPKPPLYGLWDVTAFTRDGKDLPPRIDDADRWRRLIVDTTHAYQLNTVSSQRMDGSIVDYVAAVDPRQAVITLAKADDPTWSATLAFRRPGPGRLSLSGQVDGHQVRMHLKAANADDFPVLRPGFHWVQEEPYQPRTAR
ncbi:DoxX family protein [Streptomyces ziwulingensis]|uniref:DoxX family protein n=1 Tax=Streptomyces ziwulingensis TaxID=1045501 RepID=A0ABP9CUG9_9ACTN